ncbi:MAG: SDR family oxidoreductase [Gemmatimonadota bacterium]
MTSTPVALITGASSGIGEGFARRLAAEGYDLVLVARSKDRLAALAAELTREHGRSCAVIVSDLADGDAPRILAAELERRGLVIDVLINNAGFGLWGVFAEADLQRQLDMLQVNITALAHLTGLLLPGMIGRGRGRVLNVASTAAFAPGPLMAVYYASKAYVLSFSQAIGNEVDGTGVTVTALCPGPTRTGFAAVAKSEGTKLFHGRGVMEVGPVIEAGYRGLMRGQAVVIPGWRNRLLAAGAGFAPRGLLVAITRRFQKGRE